MRLAPSIAVFKKKLLSIVHPPAKSVFGIHDPVGLSYLTQLRVGLSKLNYHKFKHNFRDTINQMCRTGDGMEDMEHFCCTALSVIFNVKISLLQLSNYLDHLYQLAPFKIML